MANACPTCHRSSTWSAKWQACSACAVAPDRNTPDSMPYTVTKLHPSDVAFVTTDGRVTEVRIATDDGIVAIAETDTTPIPLLKARTGRPPKHENHAARQRAYRERKAKTS